MRSFLLSIVLALTIATPAVADPAFGPSGCLNWPPPPGTPQSADTHPEDPFTIVDFTGGAPIEAWRSDWVARGIWATLTALYGSPGSSLPRVPILVTTHDEISHRPSINLIFFMLPDIRIR